MLGRAIEILEEQRSTADPRFLQNAKDRLRGAAEWVRRIDGHEARRTMPKTNGRAGDVIGYRYAPRKRT